MRVSKATILVRICRAIALVGWYGTTFYALVLLAQILRFWSYKVSIVLLVVRLIYTLTFGRWLVLWAVKRHPFYYLIKLEQLGLARKDPNWTPPADPLTFHVGDEEND